MKKQRKPSDLQQDQSLIYSYQIPESLILTPRLVDVMVEYEIPQKTKECLLQQQT